MSVVLKIVVVVVGYIVEAVLLGAVKMEVVLLMVAVFLASFLYLVARRSSDICHID